LVVRVLNDILKGCLGLLGSTFSALLHVFSQTVSASFTLFEGKCGVVRAPEEVLHQLQFFMELLHSRVCGAVLNTYPPHFLP
jgi:hypothetical protein